MTITIEGVDYTLPDNLRAVPLTRYVDWQTAAGLDLSQRRIEAAAIDDPEDQEVEMAVIFLDTITQTLSFFGEIPMDIVRTLEINVVIDAITRSEVGWITVPGYIETPTSFDWMTDSWHIESPDIPVEDMTYDDFNAMINIARWLTEYNKGNWANFHELAAVYLVGSEGTAPVLHPDSDRVAMMMDLPMDIGVALAQAFTSEMATFTSIINQYADAHYSL